MIRVEKALDILLGDPPHLNTETVELTDIPGRVCAETVTAQINQPPFPASAMDGYAVRSADATLNSKLSVIGEAAAGKPFPGHLNMGEAVRVFTGSVVPPGADHVIIQEHVHRQRETITVTAQQSPKHNIRAAGIDLQEGDILASPGLRMHELHGSVFAAANVSQVKVYQKPHIAVFTNGDELIEPGSSLSPGQIINSNQFALKHLVEKWGGDCTYLGRASDSKESIGHMMKSGLNADILVAVGGASVGDYDYTKDSLTALGGNIVFSKVAVKPGKPTWYGKLGKARVLGLPGNPASALVTAALFLRPLIKSLSGEKQATNQLRSGKLLSPLPANGERENYLRARIETDPAGTTSLRPASSQDSSLLKPFLFCDALIRRKPGATALQEGALVDFMSLKGDF
ncbi:MAG: molybdopterin molybdotransferase MoeA [Aquisalinus sp.]|nr:molybdopterin molybdotransferase MoeA [Aquisalinus sp.]